MNKAMGIIETIGMIPAVTALDTALKAADVKLKVFNIVKAGIVTVVIEGDVGAVNAAVDAGVISVKNMTQSVTSHVIPRPIDDINRVISNFYATDTKSKQEEIIEKDLNIVEDINTYEDKKLTYTKEGLMLMNTSDIREICKSIESIDISSSKLKKMKKEELIDIVLNEIKN